MDTLVLTRPDDAHLHLRDHEALAHVVADSARQFGRAIIMPNLKPPVEHAEQAKAYRQRILNTLERTYPDADFNPVMALYLTDRTTTADVAAAAKDPFIASFKLYPSHATTHAEAGVTNIQQRYPVFEAMAAHGLVLSIHGETVADDVDIFDRERVFIERTLVPLTTRFPTLKIILEHVTTREGVQFVMETPANVAATITAHHLLLNRNALFDGGLRPHHYCLPVLKREADRQALLAAATSGNPRFFLGTDSAPHATNAKESACGCAGIYTAPAALSWYAEAFESVNALDKLDDFASRFAAMFYGWPRNQGTITLTKAPWRVPDRLPYAENQTLTPFCAGQFVQWRLTDPV